MRDRHHRPVLQQRAPSSPPGAAPSAGRSARSPRPAPGCAGRPPPAGPARSAGPEPASASGCPDPARCPEPLRQPLRPSPTRRRSAAPRSPPSSGESSRARMMLSRTVPTNTWCSWVTRATSVRSTSSGSAVSSTPADGDRTGPRPVDPGQQPAERRLARAARADDRQPLAGPQLEINPVQHVVIVAVREPQIPARPAVARPAARRRHAILRHGRDPEQPAGRGDARPAAGRRCGSAGRERLDQRLDVQRGRRDLARA